MTNLDALHNFETLLTFYKVNIIESSNHAVAPIIPEPDPLSLFLSIRQIITGIAINLLQLRCYWFQSFSPIKPTLNNMKKLNLVILFVTLLATYSVSAQQPP